MEMLKVGRRKFWTQDSELGCALACMVLDLMHMRKSVNPFTKPGSCGSMRLLSSAIMAAFLST